MRNGDMNEQYDYVNELQNQIVLVHKVIFWTNLCDPLDKVRWVQASGDPWCH